MPRGDKTGPMGQGPMTGRALGFCSGYESPGFTKGFGGGRGRGRGRGFGGGMGRRNRFGYGGAYGVDPGSRFDYAEDRPYSIQKEELADLRSEAEYLRSRQERIEQRIKELETNNTK
ncbi:MAG: DUF5320 domain-containing protein [Bacteroidales bacterium]|nr:DUF5320 domain-containing protein [Bacteroidales bacterium]MDD4362205.1 DUF5320 domain-containing protein [Bacteroidales bacterium]MDD4431807.1 DUF5320 domain-containing protein [Bacteroidales bacterium]